MLSLHICLSFVGHSPATVVFIFDDYEFNAHFSHQVMLAAIIFLVLFMLPDPNRSSTDMYHKCRRSGIMAGLRLDAGCGESLVGKSQLSFVHVRGLSR